MKNKLLLIFVIFSYFAQAQTQTSNNLYGIVSKNYYSLVINPIDSSILYEQFDSATIRLGYMDPSVGMVYNRGPFIYNQAINLTGAALNPYDSTFVFMGGYGINTFDLNQGSITFQAPVTNPIAASFFDNFRFNNADSTMYGLSRRNIYDSITMQYTGELYLAKINTQNGVITQISPNSVGQGFALAGSAIDPYQMVFYYSTGSNLVGLDMYTGNIFNNVAMNLGTGVYFDNFTFSCADTALYGLVRQNYVTYIVDSLIGLDSIAVYDSTTVKLGKINANTGAVTTISPNAISTGGYSLNAGAAIDPNAMIYYYSNGSNIIGVSMLSGNVVSNVPFTFEDGLYFNLMRNFENCRSAVSMRQNPQATLLNEVNSASVLISPNPTNSNLLVKANFKINKLELYNLAGQMLFNEQINNTQADLNVEQLPEGVYFAKIFGNNNELLVQKIIKN
jgi:hypothetical protein